MRSRIIKLFILSVIVVNSGAFFIGSTEGASAPLPEKISAPQLQRDDCVGARQINNDGLLPYIEEFLMTDTRSNVSLYSCVNWEEGFLKSEGIGQKGSRRAAELVARGNALKTLVMLNLHADANLQEYFTRQKQVSLKIQGVLIKNAVIEEIPADPARPDDAKVMVQIPFYGISGLTSFLLDDRKIYLESLLQDSVPLPEQPSGNNYTGIILDVRHLPEIEPALFPTILSEDGEVLYEASQVNKETLQNQGMVEYVRESEVKTSRRAGGHPLIVRPILLASADEGAFHYKLMAQAQTRKRRRKGNILTVQATDSAGQIPVNVVVSVEDAKKIKQLNEQQQIDQKGSYTILIGGEIGGVQGWKREMLIAGMPSRP